MGAAKGVLISDRQLHGSDALVTAKVLAAAVKRAGFDVVIAGVESTDGYTGTLPMTLAELLGVPALTFAKHIENATGRSSSSARPRPATTWSRPRRPW